MIGRDDHDVSLGERDGSQGHGLERFPVDSHRRDMGVMIGDDGAHLTQELVYVQCRALARVIHVGLVRDAEQQHTAAVDRLAGHVQGLRRL